MVLAYGITEHDQWRVRSGRWATVWRTTDRWTPLEWTVPDRWTSGNRWTSDDRWTKFGRTRDDRTIDRRTDTERAATVGAVGRATGGAVR